MYGIGVIIFLSIIAFIGILVSRRVNTAEDYYVSGRSASTLLVSGSLIASLLSAVAFTGEAGFAYDGYPMPQIIFAALMCTGYAFGALFFGRYLRRSKALTLPEFFGKRFHSKKVRIAAGITVVIGISAYMVAVNQASGVLLSNILNVDYLLALVIMWAVYTSFTFLSGAKGVLITDTIMFFFFFFATVISIPLIINASGGWPDVFVNTQNDILSWHGITGEAAFMGTPVDVMMWAVINGVAWGFVTAISPWQTSRYLMAKNDHVVIRSGLLAPIVILLIYYFLDTAMVAVRHVNPNIAPSEEVFMWAAMNMMPTVIGIIVLSGIMAAAVSSLSTFLQLIGNSIARDIYIKNQKEYSQEQSLKIARIAMFSVSVVILIITIFPPPAVIFISYAAGTMFAASWGPVAIASIFSKKVNKEAAFWSIILGLFGVISGEFTNIFTDITLPMYLQPVIIGTLLSTISLIIGTKFGKVTKEEMIFREHILQTDPSFFDAKNMAITKRYSTMLIVSGIIFIGVAFVYYYVPSFLL